MTDQSAPAGGPDVSEAAGAVGAPATDPAFDAMAQRVLTRGHTTTWLNHWSLLHADFRALARMHAVLEAFEDARQDEVRGGAGDLVACCAQAHLQEGPVEADGVHASKRTEVGVQEGPVVQPRGRVPSGEHALCHRVERGVGREGADHAGGLGLFRALAGVDVTDMEITSPGLP